MCRHSPLHIALHVLLGLALVSVFALVFGWVVTVAWNYALPALFGLPLINFWQAVAILVLARVLTGRFTRGRHGRFGRHRWHGHRFHRHGSDAAAGLYSEWWDTEGEAAFRAYAARHLDGNGRD